MKFSSTILFTLLNAYLVSCQPVPEVHTVYVTHYTTIQSTVIDGGDATSIAVAEDTEATVTSSPNETSGAGVANLDNNAKELTTSASIAATDAQTASQDAVPTSIAKSATPATETSSSTSSTGTSQPSSGDHSGEGTFYSTGLGACGKTSQDTDYIVAVSHILYEENQVNGNSNDNSLCGKKIKATYEGNSVEVTVVDSCEGCSENDLDFSPSAFSQLADQSLGRIDITWEWVN
ncbi:uncharacterized protein AC631_02205 [Debaryomyces fabryi]|uniref:RlpA-like protein double-psi beta-barrel domain-containing protein n=1 Tax=Debaryomyces fabryi TaxID=58627 RepID=A0A0V1Q1I7_9ASCO|nr:uncharacterized protein AC631_02205 [Debaryomyces fabryi]KSA02063.1 hypothetical protein AC631_02205 [Debaryomyces fabryi]CUM46027.1 unnamed protein product [Debaryomyces fabryi]